MATIEKRDENGKVWQVRVFKGRDAAGKRQFHTHTVKGAKRDAERYATKVEHEFNMGTFIEPTNETLDGFLDGWLADVEGSLGDHTFDDYQKTLDRYIRPTLGSRKLSQINKQVVQSLFSALGKRGLSGTTVRHAHAILRAALNYAVENKQLLHNPCKDLKLPKKSRQEVRVMTGAEVVSFLDACYLDRWSALFMLALATGMRPGEVLGLRWKDVDLARHEVKVRQTLVTAGAKLSFGEPKTEKSRRTLSIPPEVTQALEEHRLRQAKERAIAGTDYANHDLVFAGSNGQPLSPRNLLSRHFKPILAAASLPKEIRMYDLRHTCATLLLQAGENIKVVSERLGHASVTLTLDTYTHVLPTMQQSATDKMGAAMFGAERANPGVL